MTEPIPLRNKTTPGLEAVGASIDGAKPVKRSARPKDGNGASSGGSRQRGRFNGEFLPKNCPVTPLGLQDGMYFYLDANRQLRALKTREHGKLDLQALWGTKIQHLYEVWPRYGKGGHLTGFDAGLVSEDLMKACAERGVWNAFERVRGRGAHAGRNGELILHLGDQVLVDGQAKEPGYLDGYVYPAAPHAGAPAPAHAAGGPDGPAAEVLKLLGTWQWRRAYDARLLLGWIGAGMIGGALPWRPLIWVTGGKGTGKSTLHKLLKLVFDDAVISVSDATAAGIWQNLKFDTLPVAFDEMEASEDNRRAFNVVKLAREAASGSLMLRGGSDHQGSSFTVRSCFLFSSILMPPLLGQDASRMAILELNELASGSAPPLLQPDRIRALGAQLRRRLVDAWPRLEQTIELYRQELMTVGHDSRGADQFGTLLGIADALLDDEVAHQDQDSAPGNIARQMPAADLAETGDIVRDEIRFMQHLLTTPIDPFRHGARTTVGEWVDRAARPASNLDQGGNDPDEANRALQAYGLKVFHIVGVTNAAMRVPYLAIANYHQGLAQLLANTHWAARSGAQGVWVQAARRLPRAERSSSSVRFAKVVCRATIVPLEVVQKLGVLEGEQILGEEPRSAANPNLM